MHTNHILSLLGKYDVPGPRYTSYPTVPAWVSTTGEADYRASLKTLKEGEKLSLYFHIPFCESLCHYCGCTQVITKEHNRSREYVDFVIKEVDRVAGIIPPMARRVTQLHFGGGTPNFLAPEELAQLVHCVKKHFEIIPSAELAIEMHPKTSTAAFCEKLKESGFNRISLGVQDFDPKVQALINRNQTHEMTEKMVSCLRKLGFDSFNFDLVYGLPGQNLEGWTKTIKLVGALKPNRLAIYSYAHVPWVRPVQRTFADSDIPPAEMKLKFFEIAYTKFVHSGYRLVGMDHFALADDELAVAADNGTIHRNFMGYSTRADAHQIGFGMSSISYAGGNYFQNHKGLKDYYSAIGGGKLATFRGMKLAEDDAIRRDLIMKIMCCGRVETAPFEKKWNIDFKKYFAGEISALSDFAGDGLLIRDDEKIQVVGHGFLFLRNIAMVFDRYLEGVRRQSATPVFSRTV